LKSKTRFWSIALASGLILTSGQLAHSQSSVYFDRNAFMNASHAVTGVQQSISFAFPFPEGPNVTIGDTTFTGRYLIRGGLGSGVAPYNVDSGFPMGIRFANGARAFGGDFSSFLSPYYSSFTARLSLDNGEVLTFTAPANPNSTFFGFISPTPIRSLTYSDGGLFPGIGLHQEMIGNLFIVQVPEPPTLGLFAFGALLLGWRWRKSRSA
jgi:hypothetical protein